MAAGIIDDKSEHCIPFILEQLVRHRAENGDAPFFLGLSAIQGAGKTTLVSSLSHALRSPPHNLPTCVLSIDDFYLPHSAQVDLAQSHPFNPLVQHRGQPSTHDLPLALSVLQALRDREPVRLPKYDKSAFGGQGDRADESTWEEVNKAGESSIEVVVLEGWCVAFRPLGNEALEFGWGEAREWEKDGNYDGQLAGHRLEDLVFVNEALKGYDELTDCLDAVIHIDAEDTRYVYKWRLQQEAQLRAEKGSGMTDEQVIKFVNGYYPAYELYVEALRRGIFGGHKGRQLGIVVGEDRRVKSVMRI